MLKFENNKAVLSGRGDELLLEYAKLTNALKCALVEKDKDSDESFADYVLFTAFKGGLDAPKTEKTPGKHEKADDDDGDAFLKMLDDLIDSLKKGD